MNYKDFGLKEKGLGAPNKDTQGCSKQHLYYIGGLLVNIAVTCIVASAIVAISQESCNSVLEEKARFSQFLEFIQCHTIGKVKWAALPTVVTANELILARWMLQLGTNTEVIDEDGWTAAHRAAESGSVPMLQLLADYGADMKARNTFGDTTIHIAIAEGHAQAVKWLLNYGGVPADIVSKVGSTPLYNAIVYYFRPQVSSVFSEILKLLLSSGANLNSISFSKDTALHLAASKGYVQAVKELLKAGADVNILDTSGETPLHRAASAGQLEVAKILVEHGANLKVQDKDGKTPIEVAKDDVVQWFETLKVVKSASSTTPDTTLSLNEHINITEKE